MQYINLYHAKASFTQLVEKIESRKKEGYIIVKNGQPAAKLVALSKQPKKRLGIAEGKFIVPDTIDQDNESITELFEGDESFDDT